MATLDSGACFGEVSLLSAEPVNASLCRVERIMCLSLSRDRSLKLMDELLRFEAAIRLVMEARRRGYGSPLGDSSR